MGVSEADKLEKYLVEKAKQDQENRNLKLFLHLMLAC